MELQLQELCRRYGEKYAVDHVSAALTPGVYGLVGANGAGKSTLMRMICGVLRPTSGEIRMNGKTIRELGERYYARIGYMPQDFGFYPDFTGREFLRYMAAVKGVREDRTEELLDKVNLQDAADRRIRTYSGGMKQRLGIAQAELNDPAILILDEPTAGLDPKERVRFRNLISELGGEKIVILSTHIVPDVSCIADTILMMKQGRFLLREPMASVTDGLRGKVWELLADERTAMDYSSRFTAAGVRHEGPLVRLRVIHGTCPAEGAVAVEPTLEDLFLYHFGEEGRGDDAGQV